MWLRSLIGVANVLVMAACSGRIGSAGFEQEAQGPGFGPAAGGTANTGCGRPFDGPGAGASNAGGGVGQPTLLPQIAGCPIFSADDAWNRDVSDAPRDDAWTARLHRHVGDARLHPDYGNSGSERYGIPINVVQEDQPKVDVTIDWYPDESDRGPFPFPDPGSARIEGGSPLDCDGDCHLLVVQTGACMLYEGYGCSYEDRWRCGGEATWDLSLSSYGQRPKSWTSADAAGLAITAGLVRLDEVRSGEIRHAIRFTVACTAPSFVAPGTHYAVPGGCDPDDPDAPPMGLRVRLRADYDVSRLSQPARVIAQAMKRYGMILADNGSNFYFQGEEHPEWTDEDIEPLKGIPASAFEVIAPPPIETY